ncbi:MAG: hypothetical protein ACW97A_07820 [Candidatus Thorarchaeota archaeon]
MTRAKTALVITGLILGAALSIIFVTNSLGLTFHYEEYMNSDELEEVLFVITDIEDANLTIRFEDDRDLLYRLDVGLYPWSEGHSINIEDKGYVTDVTLRGNGRIRSVDLVLGTGVFYKLHITPGVGSMLNTIVTYDNGALLYYHKSDFQYVASGSLTFNFKENASFVGTHFDADIQCDNLELNIDLPVDTQGSVTFGPAILTFESHGWMYKGIGYFGTCTPIRTPYLNLQITADTARAFLRN